MKDIKELSRLSRHYDFSDDHLSGSFVTFCALGMAAACAIGAIFIWFWG